MLSKLIHLSITMAQDTEIVPSGSADGGMGLLGSHILAAVVFSLMGLVVFALCIFIIERVTPFSIRKEIEEDQNPALAIIMGSMILGVSIIIAAAILG